jgi:hypothetical protein
MRFSTVISILLTFVLAFASSSSFAGKGQGGGGANADRGQQIDRDRGYDRDRSYDRDRMQDRAGAAQQDRAGAAQQDRDRDRRNIHDPSKMKDQDIYGNKLMTTEERKRYRKGLGNSDTQGSQEQFQSQHEEKMQQRALQQGQDLVPPGQGPIYGGEFMTVQERNQYREQLRLSDSESERQRLQAQHRDQVNQRANALGFEVEEAE